MRKFFVFMLCFVLITLTFGGDVYAKSLSVRWWEFQSVDTMKYSRDLARQMLTNSEFDKIIELQVSDIAKVGATHVAIGTPYDEEFVPVMRKWVQSARKYDLNVWFRGNLSGWEGWFDYPDIARSEHITGVTQFILDNKSLFEDGDMFTSCPECENGGPGDPRFTGDVEGHREFLIKEHTAVEDAFKKINKDVTSGYYSMNGDVARLVMDKATTKELGGVVAIDHYVREPKQLIEDIKDIAKKSEGKVMLGEFGVPIRNIHGSMTDEEQAAWLDTAFKELVLVPDLVGINYWVGVGGSTELWNEVGVSRIAVGTLQKYYTPSVVSINVVNDIDKKVLRGEILIENGREYAIDATGSVGIPKPPESMLVTVNADGHREKRVVVTSDLDGARVILAKNQISVWERIKGFVSDLVLRVKAFVTS